MDTVDTDEAALADAPTLKFCSVKVKLSKYAFVATLPFAVPNLQLNKNKRFKGCMQSLCYSFCCAQTDHEDITVKEVASWDSQATSFQLPPGSNDRAANLSLARPRRSLEQLEEREKQEVEPGAFYTGQWRGKFRQGNGRMERRGIGSYEGQFVGNRATGQGRFEKTNGDVYDGQWLTDRVHGKGTYTHADGSSYTGQWEDDIKSGVGVETWPDGSTFEGQYMDGKKHGHGVYCCADHSEFRGQFVLDIMEGDGQYTWPNGRTYIGQWQDSKMSGEGKMAWPDGRHYNGKFHEDKRTGFGVLTWPDGSSYSGQWENGKQHGHGDYVGVDGHQWSATWNRGQPSKSNGTSFNLPPSLSGSRTGSEYGEMSLRIKGGRITSATPSTASGSPGDAINARLGLKHGSLEKGVGFAR